MQTSGVISLSVCITDRGQQHLGAVQCFDIGLLQSNQLTHTKITYIISCVVPSKTKNYPSSKMKQFDWLLNLFADFFGHSFVNRGEVFEGRDRLVGGALRGILSVVLRLATGAAQVR